MKTLSLIVGLAVAISACGQREAQGDTSHLLTTDEDSFLQFCTEFPSSQECNEINIEAERLGLASYYGSGDDFFSDRAFGNSGMGCGCAKGEQPVLFRGVRRCESKEFFQEVLEQQIYLRYVSQPDGQKKLWMAFQKSSVNLPRLTENISACSLDFGSRCQLDNGDADCRGLVTSQGQRVQSQCRPLAGTVYGYCSDQGISSLRSF